MNFVCDRDQLIRFLKLAILPIASGSLTHPVLYNFKLQVCKQAQTLEITSFNLSTGLKLVMPCQAKEGGLITVSAKLFTEILDRLSVNDVQIKLDGTQIKITADRSNYKVSTIEADEYPDFPKIPEDAIKFSISPRQLMAGINQVEFCSSSDQTKQVLCGVNLIIQEGGLSFAATDGHRLGYIEMENEDVKFTGSVTIATGFTRICEKLFSLTTPETIELTISGGSLTMQIGEQLFITRLLEGQYPNYKTLIPKDLPERILIDRKQLIAAIERLMIISNQGSVHKLIDLFFSSEQQSVTISTETPDMGEGVEELTAQGASVDFAIAFNPGYVLQGLKAVSATEIAWEIGHDPAKHTGALPPSLIKPLGGAQFTYLVMPVQKREK